MAGQILAKGMNMRSMAWRMGLVAMLVLSSAVPAGARDKTGYLPVGEGLDLGGADRRRPDEPRRNRWPRHDTRWPPWVPVRSSW